MGIIQRQGLKHSLVSYGGTLVGAVSTLFIYPNEPELYGLWLALYAMASLLLPFASFGVNSLTIRFFPRFRDAKADHHGFLPFLLITSLVFFGVFTGVFALFRGSLLNSFKAMQFNVAIIDSQLVPVFTLTFIILHQRILTSYISNFQRIVVPAIITNLWPKISIPTLIVLAWQGFLSSSEFIWSILLIQLVQVIFLLSYLGKLGELRMRPSFAVLRSGMLREMGTYGMYGTIGGLGSVFAFRIDHVMISMLIGLSNTGVYGIAQFIGKSITVPARAVMALTGPMIASALESNNMEQVRMLYRKTSINLVILVLPMYAIVVLSIDDLFRLTSHYETLKPATSVVLLIGLGKIIGVSFGVNGQILIFSKFYRTNLIAILLLAIINTTLNYMLIPTHGIVGAALASLIATTSYNIFHAAIIWHKMRMQPYTWRTAIALLLASVAGIIAWIIPDTGIPMLDIAQNSILVLVLYMPIIINMRLSEDINSMLLSTISRMNQYTRTWR